MPYYYNVITCVLARWGNQQKVNPNIASLVKRIVWICVVITVSADGLVQFGTRTSADAVMIKYSSCITGTTGILTLNMRNFLKDYERYIHILNPILDLAWLNQMKLTLEQHYLLSVLQRQYHACWCLGDFRSQGISRDGIDPQKPEYSVSSIRWVNSHGNISKSRWIGDWLDVIFNQSTTKPVPRQITNSTFHYFQS